MWILYGAVLFLAALIPLVAGPDQPSPDRASASMTMTFVVMGLGTVFNALTNRRDPTNGLSPPILQALAISLVPVALIVLATQLARPAGRTAHGALTGAQWLQCVGLALLLPLDRSQQVDPPPTRTQVPAIDPTRRSTRPALGQREPALTSPPHWNASPGGPCAGQGTTCWHTGCRLPGRRRSRPLELRGDRVDVPLESVLPDLPGGEQTVQSAASLRISRSAWCGATRRLPGADRGTGRPGELCPRPSRPRRASSTRVRVRSSAYWPPTHRFEHDHRRVVAQGELHGLHRRPVVDEHGPSSSGSGVVR